MLIWKAIRAHSSSSEVRRKVATDLAARGDRGALGTLLRLSTDADDRVRDIALKAILSRNDPEAITTLVSRLFLEGILSDAKQKAILTVMADLTDTMETQRNVVDRESLSNCQKVILDCLKGLAESRYDALHEGTRQYALNYLSAMENCFARVKGEPFETATANCLRGFRHSIFSTVLAALERRIRSSEVRRAFADVAPLCLDALPDAMRRTNSDGRLGIVEELEGIPDTKATDLFIQALGDASPRVRSAALDGLAKRKDAKAVPVLMPFLTNEDAHVKGMAEKAITEFPDAALPLLLEAINGGNRKAREASVRVLGKLGRSAVNLLESLLGDRDARLRRAAACALGEIGDPASVTVLLRAAKDDDGGVSHEACLALQKIGPAALAPLISLINHENPHLRCRVAISLGNLKGGFKEIVGLLNDPESSVRRAAATALGNFGKVAFDALVPIMQDGDPQLRLACVTSMGNIGPISKDAIIASFRDSDSQVRMAAVKAVAQMGQSGLEALINIGLEDADPSVRNAAVSAIASSRDRIAVKALRMIMEHKERFRWEEAAAALLVMGELERPSGWNLQWPGLLHGPNTLSVNNPNAFAVRVGVSSSQGSTEFTVEPHGSGSTSLPNGRFSMYFQFSNEPYSARRGDDVELRHSSASISIVRLEGGNYHIG